MTQYDPFSTISLHIDRYSLRPFPLLPPGDKTIKLWSLSDSSCLRTLEGHTASVLRACFVTAGTQVGQGRGQAWRGAGSHGFKGSRRLNSTEPFQLCTPLAGKPC